MLRKTGRNGKRLLLPDVPQGIKRNEMRDEIHLIKTVTKFSNLIGYQQPNLSTNRTVYT